MKLAISSPSKSIYSETFISMQRERLPHSLYLSGGPIASETEPFGPIKPQNSVRGWVEAAWAFGVTGEKWKGPQAAEVDRRMRKMGVNVVLANYGVNGAALAPTCRKLRIPLVTHFHGFDAHQKKVLHEHSAEYKVLAELGAGFIAVSTGMVKALVEMGFPEKKIHLLRYGVDPSRFSGEINFPLEPLFFGVGRFTDKKAPYLSVMAFAKVVDSLPTAKLVLAGEGELLEVAQNIALAYGLKDAVDFPGVLSPEEVVSYLERATAFVQHSIEPLYGPNCGDREGTPVAVLEAMMAGVPVISTRHAGIREVIEDGESGYLVDERDVNAMAAAMIAIGSSRELAQRLGDTARKRAIQSFTANQYIKGLKSILEVVSR